MEAGQAAAMDQRTADRATLQARAGYNPLQERDPAVVHTIREMVVGLLGERRTISAIIEAVDTVRWWALSLISRLPPPPHPLACRAGCPWCCYLPVGVTAAEAVRIAEYLRTTLPACMFEAVREQVAGLDEGTRHMDEDARAIARLPCPLLDDRLCSVYAVRPLACIAWTSFDALACKAAWYTATPATVPAHAVCYQAVMSVRLGLRSGLADVGLDGEKLDLTTAVRIALEVPDGAERWLAGEPVFAPARWESRRSRPVADSQKPTPASPSLQ
ncbi:MAG: YkgJ family cysteine cluster protein [Chloroflexi bacterium]|nr:MAG: YkgJ family cysteine cluster protein [Chloroflexota bacterium]